MNRRGFAIVTTLWLLGLALTLLSLLSGPNSLADEEELTVCTTGPPDCKYSTVREAVDAADSGEVIRVGSGVYTGVTSHDGLSQVVYLSKTVTIRGGYSVDLSEWDPARYTTTLDAQGQGRVLYISGEISPTVEGLCITGGMVEAPLSGGGILVTSTGITAVTTISGNQVYNNTASAGGGIHIQSARVTISNNVIYSNTADRGGGLGARHAQATITGNTFSHNHVTQAGGGLSLIGGSAWLKDNKVYSNTASSGGGLDLDLGEASLVNNVIAANRAQADGCGLASRGSLLLMIHNTFARNSGPCSSGLFFTSRSVDEPSMVTMTNTILVSHTLGISITVGNTASLEASLWGTATWAHGADWGGAGAISTGTLNVRGDPAFVDPDGGDYHIGETSAAKDTGIDSGVSTDIDGQPRPRDGGYDIGADEFHPVFDVFLPLIARRYTGIPEPIVLDRIGVEQDWDWLQENLGAVEITRTEAGPAYRACVFQEVEGPSTQVIRVTGNDEPLPGRTVIRTWPDAPPLPPDLVSWYDNGVFGLTNPEGKIGFGMGGGDAYFPPAGGAASVWVAEVDYPSDLVGGLGWLGLTNHVHLDIEFCLLR